MKLVIQTDSGSTLQEFIIPEDAIRVNDDQAIAMGRTVADSINKLIPEMIDYEEKLLKHCTCFWKDKTPEARKHFRNHSSQCGVWDLD